MSRFSLFSLILLAGIQLFCCPSSQTSQQSHAIASQDSTTTISRPPKVSQPTTIKPNVTIVHAVIDSIANIDDTQYRLFVRVTSVEPMEDLPSLVEPNQQLTLTPQYIATESGQIDLSQDVNKRLFDLRSARIGAKFIGRVALLDGGTWVLLDVNNR